ncbi:MAG: hypothetical protein ACOWYE_05290 [Desulfatiglandales bacterium]
MQRDKKETPDFNFAATGIGSVPFLDIQGTCRTILEHFPRIPFWPQFFRRSHLEDMNIQFTEGLPLLTIDGDRRKVVISNAERENALVTFYEHFLAEDLSHFAISRDFAPGLYAIVESVEAMSERFGPFIKGQTIGPITFAATISGPDGKSVLYDPELMEAMVQGLAIKALWQVKELARTGKRPILFLDEPYLSGFGSAFSPIQRQDVVNYLKEVINFVRERSSALIGIHCCGNTDWSMIMEAGPDIVNFDAHGYMDYFLLYPDELLSFIHNGGGIAWGIVPTIESNGTDSVEGLCSRLHEGLNRLHALGLEPDILSARSLLTPACGMGTMDQPMASRALQLLSLISERMQ